MKLKLHVVFFVGRWLEHPTLEAIFCSLDLAREYVANNTSARHPLETFEMLTEDDQEEDRANAKKV